MKLPTRKPQEKPEPACGQNPPGVTPLPGNPFYSREAVRVWARGASQKGRHEVVIELADGRVIKGSLLPLPGFYDASVSRFVSKTSLFDRKSRRRDEERKQDD
jgi:hypothetical protein